MQLKKGKTNSIKYKKTLITIFVNKIYLYDDRLTIIFNVGKNTVTADFTILEDTTNINNNEQGLYFNKLDSPKSKAYGIYFRKLLLLYIQCKKMHIIG